LVLLSGLCWFSAKYNDNQRLADVFKLLKTMPECGELEVRLSIRERMKREKLTVKVLPVGSPCTLKYF
jgi:hypothetical protein